MIKAYRNQDARHTDSDQFCSMLVCQKKILKSETQAEILDLVHLKNKANAMR